MPTRPLPFLSLLLLACLLGGCKPDREPVPDIKGGMNGALAYEHKVKLEAPFEDMERIVRTVLDRCAKLADRSCTMLASDMAQGKEDRASVKVRASPQGVRQIIAAVSALGSVTSRSTTAEDLSEPINDVAEQLKMLSAYKAQLQAMSVKPDVRIGDLLEIQMRLSSTQSEIEKYLGQQAGLRRRVATEVLSVELVESYHASFGEPIRYAARDFLADLARGIALAITGTAFILPAGIVLLLVFKLAGVARRWWRRRAEARAAQPA